MRDTRKIVRAAAVLAIFSLSVVTLSIHVQASFTLGDLTGTYPFHTNDFDPHVSGVIAYVWPGSGQNSYLGSPNIASPTLSPGYQSPYPGGNPPGAPSNSWYQLQADSYSPFGAVLSGSTGDLIFAINATANYRTDGTAALGPRGAILTRGWTGITIALPPNFTVPDSSQVVSTLTNDYGSIYTTRAGLDDRYAPGWTLVTVLAENGRDGSATFPPAIYYDRQTIQFTAAKEWYYVRINGVTAPAVAGRYFFKILLWGDSGYLGGPEGTASCGGIRSSCYNNLDGGRKFSGASDAPTQFVPTENWPVMLVKGEIDPAIITGTVRYGGYNQTLYNQPIGEAGVVYAKMTTRIDPYTGQQRPDLPLVDAVGYVNATAQGHFEVEGLAPGIYDLYASAAGYPKTLCKSGVTASKGQSLHLDCYVQPGPVVHGNVFSKHQFGDEPWPTVSGTTVNGQYIKIELYDGPTLNHKPDPSANLISWSPKPCVAGGQLFYFGWGHAGLCGDPRTGGEIAFPWHEYTPGNGYGLLTPGGYFLVSTGLLSSASSSLNQDPMGVGPPQRWFVQGGTTTPFHFEFGVKGEYGAPRDLDGMVPQVYATWVNGLTPGRYYVRAWTFRYVQSALDGSTFQEYYFDVTPNEWAGEVTLPIDIRLSSWVNETVYFHDIPDTLTTAPIDTGAQLMSGTLIDANGQVWSYNQTLLGCGTCGGIFPLVYGNGPYNGGTATAFWKTTSFEPFWGIDLDRGKVNAHAIETGRANIQFWGWNDTWDGENYGIPSGTYTTRAYVLGYLEQNPQAQVSVTLSGNPTIISRHQVRGAGFKVTLYSIDWERPRVSRPWVWGNPTGTDYTGHRVGQEIDVGLYQNGTLVDFMSEAGSSVAGANPLATLCLYQGGDVAAGCTGVTDSSVQARGGGWNPTLPDGTVYQGDANGAFFGREILWPGFVGGYTQGTMVFETTNSFFAPFHQNTILVPTAFDSGQYDLRAYTYGYVQDKAFSVFVKRGQVADNKINLVVGVNVSLDILFKKESIITPTTANMSARVRLFDDSHNLVSEWMSSEGTYVTGNGLARAADGTNQYPFGPLLQTGIGVSRTGLTPTPNLLNTYNFLPGGVTLLHVLMAGLPQVPPTGQEAYLAVPRAGFGGWGLANEGYNSPYFGDPIFTHAPNYPMGGSREHTCDFELDCYTNPGSNWNAPGFFPNTGILGSPDYMGGWTAEVDFVNLYANNTGSIPNYYPPVEGLLMGESYHIIPGTTATSGISFTEDAALNPAYLGHSMASNHLGPYSQEGVWQIAGTHNSGEASAIFEVDKNGLVSGNVLAFTSGNEFRTQSWGTITVTGANGATWNLHTFDGLYETYLPPGNYKLSINEPGYAPQTWTVTVSPGQKGTGENIYLEENGVPVPEFGGAAIAIFSTLAALLYVLKRRRK